MEEIGDRNLSRPLRLPGCASHPDGTVQQSDRCHPSCTPVRFAWPCATGPGV